MIRPAEPADLPAILRLAQLSGLFPASELGGLGEQIEAYFEGNLEGHAWLVDEDEEFKAAAYYAPELFTDGTWNLYFIAVMPGARGEGRGAALVRHIEDGLRAEGERMLMIETSGDDFFAPTRAFYTRSRATER